MIKPYFNSLSYTLEVSLYNLNCSDYLINRCLVFVKLEIFPYGQTSVLRAWTDNLITICDILPKED